MAVLAPPAQAAPAVKQVIQANTFTKASRRKTEPFYDKEFTLGASASNPQQIDIPAAGYLRSILIDVEGSGFTGATYNDDAPFNVLDRVQMADVNGQQLFLADGYHTFLTNLFGGYNFYGDPRQSPTFLSTATGFKFQFRIPVEIIQRNALGALVNMNAAMTYKMSLSLAPAAEIFSAITGTATVRIRALMESWANPNANDLRGIPNTVTPPALGTTQNWAEYAAPVLNGNNTIRLPRVGNTIRNLIFEYRDDTGVRTDSGMPEEISVFIDGNQWTREWRDYQIQRIWELYGYDASVIPVGIWVVCLTDDFDGTPGEEIGDYWLDTTPATRLEVRGSFTATGSLSVLTNDIIAFATGPTNGGA